MNFTVKSGACGWFVSFGKSGSIRINQFGRVTTWGAHTSEFRAVKEAFGSADFFNLAKAAAERMQLEIASSGARYGSRGSMLRRRFVEAVAADLNALGLPDPFVVPA